MQALRQIGWPLVSTVDQEAARPITGTRMKLFYLLGRHPARAPGNNASRGKTLDPATFLGAPK
jgi:hypothetical protein